MPALVNVHHASPPVYCACLGMSVRVAWWATCSSRGRATLTAPLGHTRMALHVRNVQIIAPVAPNTVSARHVPHPHTCSLTQRNSQQGVYGCAQMDHSFHPHLKCARYAHRVVPLAHSVPTTVHRAHPRASCNRAAVFPIAPSNTITSR